MKQFVVIAYDAKDAGALDRRMQARPAHIAMIDTLRAEGKILCGLALLGSEGKMHGSVCVYNFPTRAELDACLKNEPYVVHEVWDKITVLDAKLGPSFEDLLKKAS